MEMRCERASFVYYTQHTVLFFLFERMENSFYDIMIFTSGSWIFKFALLVCVLCWGVSEWGVWGEGKSDLCRTVSSFPRCNMFLFAEQKEYGIFTAVALFPGSLREILSLSLFYFFVKFISLCVEGHFRLVLEKIVLFIWFHLGLT